MKHGSLRHLLLSASLAACSSSSTPSSTATDTGTVDVGASPDVASDVGEVLAYPPPPYGVTKGETFPDATWDGVRSGTAAAIKISSIDYYDPKGDRGIRAAVILVNGVPKGKGLLGCGPCDAVFAAISADMTGAGFDWQARGVRGLELGYIYPDKQVSLATLTGVRAPSALDEAVLVVASGPTGAMPPSPFAAPFDAITGVPVTFVVDPRTMKIEVVQLGEATMGGPVDEVAAGVEKVAIANGAPTKP
jgi:hypothetical protein